MQANIWHIQIFLRIIFIKNHLYYLYNPIQHSLPCCMHSYLTTYSDTNSVALRADADLLSMVHGPVNCRSCAVYLQEQNIF